MDKNSAPNQQTSPESGVIPPISSSGLVLGYPETAPANIDLGPVPSGVGAKPTSKSSGAAPKSTPATHAKSLPPKRSGPPLPKRPKGRLFIGSAFLAVLLGLGYTIFNSKLRYSAYGTVVGRRIELAVPWPGVVRSMHVREGQSVTAGQTIAIIDNLEMRQKIDAVFDSLRLERANMASKVSMLRWEAEKIRDARKLSLSEFYDKWSQLLLEQSRLADLRMQVKRIEPIYLEGAATEERLDSLRFQLAGQEKRVEQLTEAVRSLKQRIDTSPLELTLDDQIQPSLARIENLQAELLRTRELIRQGELRAPAAGRIVRTHRFVGEYADQATPVAELFVDGSTELVVFIPQSEVQDYPIGRTVQLHVDLIDQSVSCEVQRIAMETRPAPASIARYYRHDETLLPVHFRIKPIDSLPGWIALGSEVRLPRSEEISALCKVKRWWEGQSKQQDPQIANPLRPDETLIPVQTASAQDQRSRPADNNWTGHEDRMAGWIRRP